MSGTGHFRAGQMITVCLALTLSWAETLPLLPLLRWAQSLWRATPYFAGPPRLDCSSHSLRGAEPCRGPATFALGT